MIKNLLAVSTLIMCVFTLNAQTTILDFETSETSTNFQYFGSSLENMLSSVIANPDPSGINTSSMVAEFMKPAGAEVWAGGFSEPNPTAPIDFTSDNEICLKVWTAQPVNLLLKLEQSSNGFGDWENAQQIDQTNTWVEICYSALAPDASNAQNGPAAGGTFNRLVLFFGFGDAPAEDATYFFDDVVVQSADAAPVSIDFSVDMNGFSETFTTVYVSGTFNEWSGTANPLADDDGDGVWTGSVAEIPIGGHEYKFTIDDWAIQEDFNDADYTCTVRTVTDTDVFTNRSLAASTNASQPTVCFNSCFACGESVILTVNLGDGGIPPAPEGFFIAGGGNFGDPGQFPLTDPDGDGVHSGRFERPMGFESFYTFTNGACLDFSCKEMIAGQDCSNPDNFDDRFMGPLNGDTTINTCFGECTDNTDCMASLGNITFEVDMNGFTGTFTTVFLSGNFNGWSGNANPMTDNGNGLWSTTIPLVFDDYEFKFQVDEWAVQEEFTEGNPCTITDPSGQFVNRALTVDNTEQTLCFQWNTCESCLVSLDNVDNTIFSLQPTLVSDHTTIIFGSDFTAEKDIRLFNSTGQHIHTMNIASGVPQHTLDATELPDGIYFIHIQTENLQQTKRIIVNK